MEKKDYAVGALILAVVLLGFGLTKTPKVEVDVTAVIPDETSKGFGAFSGPDILSPFLFFNRIGHYFERVDFRQSTSTTCSYRTPNATTTLLAWSVNQRTATATPLRWEFGTSTVYDATTTLYARYDIATQRILSGVVPSSTTTPSGANVPLAMHDVPIPPLTYLNVKVGGGPDNNNNGSAYNLAGSCTYELKEI